MLPHRTRLPVVNAASLAGSATVEAIPPASESRRTLRKRTVTANGFPDRAMTWRVLRQETEREELELAWRALSPGDGSRAQALAEAEKWYSRSEDRFDEALVFVVSKRGEPAVILPCYRKGREIRLAGDQPGGFPDVLAGEEATDAEIRDALRLLSAWVRRRCAGCELVFDRLSPGGRLLPLLEAMDPAREQWYRHRQSSETAGAIPLSEVDGNPATEVSADSVPAWVSIRLLPRTVEAFPRFLGMVLRDWWPRGQEGAASSGGDDATPERRSGDVDSVSSRQGD